MIIKWIREHNIDVGQEFYINNHCCVGKVFLVNKAGELLERTANDILWSYSKVPMNLMASAVPSLLMRGDTYYYPSLEKGVEEATWSDSWEDNNRAKLHLVFKEREDAKFMLKDLEGFCMERGA